MTTAAFLGIDVGTTAVKAMLVGEGGQLLAETDAEQSVSTPQAGWAEQDPEMWWTSTKSAVNRVMARASRLPGNIQPVAVGLSGQMHSSVFLDEQFDVIRPAILWNDTRTTSQCQDITSILGLEGLHRTVGNLALEGFTAPKVLWLRENEPDNYSQLRWLLLPKDYVRWKMTGELATDPSDAAGTILFDVRNRRWSTEMLQSLEIPSEILPEVVGSNDVSGTVSQSSAEALGLPVGLPVVGGGADNAAGAVGSGTVEPGRVQASIGTSGTLLTPIAQPHVDEQMRLHTFCHCVPDQWYLMGTILSAGASLAWLHGILSQEGSLDYDEMFQEAHETPLGADRLLFLPYMTGERTPHNDSNARGVFFGLHLAHTRGHLVRAVLEGVCFALRDSLELMRAQGSVFTEVRSIGGGLRSQVWRQILADVLNLPVATIGPSSGPAYGAALMSAVGAGHLSSIGETVEAWLRIEETTDPDLREPARYQEIYSAYRELYPSLKDRFAQTRRLDLA